MCGIVAYVGKRKGLAAPLVLEGLKKLEYRGYDSWGIATLTGKKAGPIAVVKRVGKIGSVDATRVSRSLGTDGEVAIGHTRWATHGGITQRNAHPHLDCSGTLAVVHNGIIENYQEFRERLKRKGHRLLSETDTEIIPHLIEELMLGGKSFKDAVIEVSRRFQGRSAFVVMDSRSREIAAVRLGAPLIVGVGKKRGEFYVGSDISAFLDHTNKVMYIDDGQVALIDFRGKKPRFFDIASGDGVYKRVIAIDWRRGEVSKAGYDHFLM